jgi:hypothetical protein
LRHFPTDDFEVNSMNKITLYVPFFLLFWVVSMTFSGCFSDGACRVTGVITLDGQPLAEANVSFVPKIEGEGVLASGMTDSTGAYQLQTLSGKILQGTLPGEYVVVVRKSEAIWDGKSYYPALGDGEPLKQMQVIEKLPRKYTMNSSTPFSATVTKGQENTFNFDVESSKN